jgi:hypothetical protein
MQDVRLRKQRILFMAVIAEAVQDAQDSQDSQPRVRQAARAWLLEDDQDFPQIWGLAGIDCDYLRQNLASRISSSPLPNVPVPPSEQSRKLRLAV